MFLIVLAPGLVFSNIFTFKVGMFIPRAQFESRIDNLWWIELDQMSFNKDDYNSSIFGFSFEYFLTPRISLVFGVDGYTRNKAGWYEDYVGYTANTLGTDYDFAFPADIYEPEFDPQHSFSVSITPIQASLKLIPLGRRGKLIPFVGGGVGIYLWNIRLYGDMINFYDEYHPEYNDWYYNDITGVIHQHNYVEGEDVPIYPILITDAREDNRLTVGYHAFGGLMIPVARRMTLEFEFKYNFVKGDLKEGFRGFERFDLSSYQLSVGINYWF